MDGRRFENALLHRALVRLNHDALFQPIPKILLNIVRRHFGELLVLRANPAMFQSPLIDLMGFQRAERDCITWFRFVEKG